MPNDEIAAFRAEMLEIREFRKATEKRLYLLETAAKKAPDEPAVAPVAPHPSAEEYPAADESDAPLAKDKPTK